jgi:hypothetical protein
VSVDNKQANCFEIIQIKTKATATTTTTTTPTPTQKRFQNKYVKAFGDFA